MKTSKKLASIAAVFVLEISLSVSATSPLPPCEFQTESWATLNPDGSIVTLKAVEGQVRPNLYRWDEFLAQSGSSMLLAVLPLRSLIGIPNRAHLDSFLSYGKKVVVDSSWGIMTVNRKSGSVNPIQSGYYVKAATAIDSQGRIAALVSQRIEPLGGLLPGKPMSLKLFVEEPDNELGWQLVAQVDRPSCLAHTGAPARTSVALAYDKNDQIVGLCGGKNGAYLVGLSEDNKLTFQKITDTLTTESVVAQDPNGSIAFFAFSHSWNPAVYRLVKRENIWVKEILEGVSGPWTFAIATSTSNLVYESEDEGSSISNASLIGNTWEVERIDPETAILHSAISEPLRILSVQQDSLVFHQLSDEGWTKTVIQEPTFSTTIRCSVNSSSGAQPPGKPEAPETGGCANLLGANKLASDGAIIAGLLTLLAMFRMFSCRRREKRERGH